MKRLLLAAALAVCALAGTEAPAHAFGGGNGGGGGFGVGIGWGFNVSWNRAPRNAGCQDNGCGNPGYGYSPNYQQPAMYGAYPYGGGGYYPYGGFPSYAVAPTGPTTTGAETNAPGQPLPAGTATAGKK